MAWPKLPTLKSMIPRPASSPRREHFATKATLDAKGGPDVSAASLLPDGKVLFAAEPTSEIYDPVSGSFSLTGSMTTRCFYGEKPTYILSRTATVLQNGKVLLTGGSNGIGA